MKLVGAICKLDRFLDDRQIVQRNLEANLPIGRLARLADWKDHAHSNDLLQDKEQLYFAFST